MPVSFSSLAFIIKGFCYYSRLLLLLLKLSDPAILSYNYVPLAASLCKYSNISLCSVIETVCRYSCHVLPVHAVREFAAILANPSVWCSFSSGFTD